MKADPGGAGRRPKPLRQPGERGRRESIEAAVGVGLAIVGLLLVPVWIVLVAVGVVVGLVWFERSRSGWLVPGLCLALIVGGGIWGVLAGPAEAKGETASTTVAAATTDTADLEVKLDRMDQAIQDLQHLVRSGQVTTVPTQTSSSSTPTGPSAVVRPEDDVLAPLRQSILNYTNEVRADAGVAALRLNPELTAAADVHSKAMAAKGSVFHASITSTYGPLIPEWKSIAENVGVASSAREVVNALMASPVHAANMTGSAFTEIGVGVAFGADFKLYVTLPFAGR